MPKSKSLTDPTNLFSPNNFNSFVLTRVTNDLVEEELIMVLQYRLFHEIIIQMHW